MDPEVVRRSPFELLKSRTPGPDEEVGLPDWWSCFGEGREGGGGWEEKEGREEEEEGGRRRAEGMARPGSIGA